MTRELITTWNDYQAAADRLLAMACRRIAIYDENLAWLKLDSPANLEHLLRILKTGQGEALHIALRDASPLAQRHPALVNLLTTYSHRAAVQQTPQHLAHLRDSMILVDGKHALIRFDRDQARSKLLIDEAEELRPYVARFEEILAAGGEPVRTTTLGL
ncbi:MAG: hypothetical protein F9K30_13430 [Dechloromonas sp.]|nr:MAG: hypothetical protein F9K30_13430 [Dechloromonas sp.]